MPLEITMTDNGSFRKLQNDLKDLPDAVMDYFVKKGLFQGAKIIVDEAKRIQNFKARRPVFGLAGTWRVIRDMRNNRVLANYGDRFNRHAHLIEEGTKVRPNRGRVKPYKILQRAFRHKRRQFFNKVDEETRKQVKKFLRDRSKGRAISPALQRAILK